MAKEIHVVMFPWLAFGHLVPFRHLSVALARKGIRVSFISTPKNIQRLAKIPTELTHLVTMVEFTLPTMAILEGAEATVDLPSHELFGDFLLAYDQLKEPFKQFVVDKSPDWILIDVLSPWAAEVANEFGIPVILYSAFTAAFLSFLGPSECFTFEGRKEKKRLSPESMMTTPEWFNFPSLVTYRRHEAKDFYAIFYREVSRSGVTCQERFFRVYNACKAFSIRSCPEVESKYLTVLGNVIGKPVFPVGLLFPEDQKSERDGEETLKGIWGNMFKWLDEQEKRSVVFVGFGSECKLAKEHVHEIAYGLEMSKLPFFWVLPYPSWAAKNEDEDENEDDVLPAGFRNRIGCRGVVKLGWAPQPEILAHPSITCSLFHSGWGSTIEMLQQGHAMVLLPFMFDQSLNARMLVEKGLAIEVDRDEENGSFTRDDIAKCLKLAMVSEQADDIRKRAISILEDAKLHEEQYLARFVEYLRS